MNPDKRIDSESHARFRVPRLRLLSAGVLTAAIILEGINGCGPNRHVPPSPTPIRPVPTEPMRVPASPTPQPMTEIRPVPTVIDISAHKLIEKALLGRTADQHEIDTWQAAYGEWNTNSKPSTEDIKARLQAVILAMASSDNRKFQDTFKTFYTFQNHQQKIVPQEYVTLALTPHIIHTTKPSDSYEQLSELGFNGNPHHPHFFVYVDESLIYSKVSPLEVAAELVMNSEYIKQLKKQQHNNPQSLLQRVFGNVKTTSIVLAHTNEAILNELGMVGIDRQGDLSPQLQQRIGLYLLSQQQPDPSLSWQQTVAKNYMTKISYEEPTPQIVQPTQELPPTVPAS